MIYHGTSYDVVKADGRPAYRGPMKRARLWASVFSGRVERSDGKKFSDEEAAYFRTPA